MSESSGDLVPERVSDLAVTESGTGDRLVVFVHGVLDRGRSFEPIAERLDGRCRTVWYDRRGYGASASAPGVPVGVDGHVADLLAVLDGRRAVLVAHSFGGIHAFGAAIRAPELIEAVVAYETVTAWAPGWPDTAMRDVLSRDDPEAAGLELMLGPRLASMAPDQIDRRRPEARAFVAEERSIRTGGAPYDVGAIRAPVVYGASDSEVIEPVITFLADTIPDIEVVRMPGADHFAHRSDPDGFAALVRLALARSAASPT
ncbi:MAG TPA: alpha/beta hydrolase [Acidimicrobiales bacterium]